MTDWQTEPEAYTEHEAEHPFADRTDEWRRIRDTAYAGVPGQDEGIEGPGPYYPEYQISGQTVHPGREYEYEYDQPGPGAWHPRREWSGEWAGRSGARPPWPEAQRPLWQWPARRWAEAHPPPGWRRISRGHAVGWPPEAWTRPGSVGPTTGGVGGHYGKAPKGYVRSDERIREDVCDRFMSISQFDCSDIEVGVERGEVTLNGTVDSRRAKHHAEDIAAEVLGVKDVRNHLRVSSHQ